MLNVLLNFEISLNKCFNQNVVREESQPISLNQIGLNCLKELLIDSCFLIICSVWSLLNLMTAAITLAKVYQKKKKFFLS
jgi:hypothetical protein